jgi:hypothetical protein
MNSIVAFLDDAQEKLLRSEIHQPAVHTTRASEIGRECERYLFYERTASETKVLHGPDLQAIFELGKELEKYVLRRLENMGCEVVQKARDWHERELEFTGHVDARIGHRDWSRPAGVASEIKGLNPYWWDSIRSADDLKNHKAAPVRRYYAQVQSYLWFEGEDLGLLIALNKLTGKLKFVEIPRDEEFITSILAKVARIRDAVKTGEPPERFISEQCDRCPHVATCAPDRSFGPGLSVVDDPELINLVNRRAELAPAVKEYAEIDDRLKHSLPEASEILLGDFVVLGKERTREGYTVKATRWFERRFKRVKKEG